MGPSWLAEDRCLTRRIAARCRVAEALWVAQWRAAFGIHLRDGPWRRWRYGRAAFGIHLRDGPGTWPYGRAAFGIHLRDGPGTWPYGRAAFGEHLRDGPGTWPYGRAAFQIGRAHV